jgi:hypothetical protein
VVFDLVALGALVALALGGDHVQQLRTLEVLERAQRLQQRRDVVAVDRPGVVETHFLEQRGRHEHALPVFFPALDEARCGVVLVTEQALAAFAHGIERAACGEAAEHLGQAADVFRDRHAGCR